VKEIVISSSETLTIELAGATAADQPEFVCSYVDSTFGPGSTKGETNSATPVTLAGSPAAGVYRAIHAIWLVNLDSASVTAIVKITGGTSRTVLRRTLVANECSELLTEASFVTSVAGLTGGITAAALTAALNAATASLQGMMTAAQYNLLVWQNSETDLGTESGGAITVNAATHGKQKVTLGADATLLPANVTNLSTYGSVELTAVLNANTITSIIGWVVDDSTDIADWVGATSVQLLLQYAHGVNILHVVRLTT